MTNTRRLWLQSLIQHNSENLLKQRGWKESDRERKAHELNQFIADLRKVNGPLWQQLSALR